MVVISAVHVAKGVTTQPLACVTKLHQQKEPISDFLVCFETLSMKTCLKAIQFNHRILAAPLLLTTAELRHLQMQMSIIKVRDSEGSINARFVACLVTIRLLATR